MRKCSTSLVFRENAKQNHNEMLLTPTRMGSVKEVISGIDEDEKSLLVGMQNNAPTSENSLTVSQMLNTELPCDLEILLLFIYPS